jgi:hopanoid biosynthesis associated protein HpnK
MQAIFNADDFGASGHVNSAVGRAFRHGVLTSASLVAGGARFEDAVSLARQLPGLAVGLHVVVCDGRPVSDPHSVPHLVDRRGFLLRDPVHLGVLCFANRAARAELRQELRAQFERFASTGLALSHVDGHAHMHMHPTVFSMLVPLAMQYGAQGFRLPRDDAWLALKHSRKRAGTKLIWAAEFWALCQGRDRALRRAGLCYADTVYGLMQTGAMTPDYVAAVLFQADCSTCELYFHPSTDPSGTRYGPNRGDLQTLLDPGIRDSIDQRGIQLATYPSLLGAGT